MGNVPPRVNTIRSRRKCPNTECKLKGKMIPILGLSLNENMIVQSLNAGRSADQAGLRTNDIICSINSKMVTSRMDYRLIMSDLADEDVIIFTVSRSGQIHNIRVVIPNLFCFPFHEEDECLTFGYYAPLR